MTKVQLKYPKVQSINTDTSSVEDHYLLLSTPVLTPVRMSTDPNSAANFNSFLTDHLHLSLQVDFTAKILKGFVEISLRKLDESHLIVLDVNGVNVKFVSCETRQVPVQIFSCCRFLPSHCFL